MCAAVARTGRVSKQGPSPYPYPGEGFQDEAYDFRRNIATHVRLIISHMWEATFHMHIDAELLKEVQIHFIGFPNSVLRLFKATDSEA